jgi:hypothetical protein
MERLRTIVARSGGKLSPEKQWFRFAVSASAAIAIIVLMVSADSGAAQDATSVEQAATAGAADPLLKEPYVDTDEWRETPIRHRYIHGGFNGTPARFSIYFPPKDRYHGRFFQHVTPTPIDEKAATSPMPSSWRWMTRSPPLPESRLDRPEWSNYVISGA